ncbi:MAG: hypothetical protein R2757_15750 [Draconibacterium sp.]
MELSFCTLGIIFLPDGILVLRHGIVFLLFGANRPKPPGEKEIAVAVKRVTHLHEVR